MTVTRFRGRAAWMGISAAEGVLVAPPAAQVTVTRARDSGDGHPRQGTLESADCGLRPHSWVLLHPAGDDGHPRQGLT